MRNLQLDLLRALAIILVLGFHMPKAPVAVAAPLQAFLHGWQHVGWIGVDLFFVLSGFLVSGLIFREFAKTGDFHLFHFLVRRGLKIYPSYYVFLLLSLPAIAWVPGLVTAFSFACEALFLSNYFANIWGHTWTLCIEEHFYMLLSLGFFILRRSKEPFKYLVPCCYFFLLMPFCLRVNSINHLPLHAIPNFVATALRLDALTFGVLLSCHYHRHQQQLMSYVRRFNWLLTILGFILILPCAIAGCTQFYLYTVGLTLLYIGWGMLLLVAMSYDLQTKNKTVHTIAKVGVFSYSIYLWHKPFAGLCSLPSETWPGHLDASTRLLIYFVGSLFVGIVMSKLIEWPLLRFRDSHFPSLSPKPVAESSLMAADLSQT